MSDIQETKLLVNGITFGDKPKQDDARLQNVIVAKHIDPVRDEQAGVEISKYNLNYVFAAPDSRDHLFSDIFGVPDPKYLPSVTDLRENWGEILDQLDLGSCVSNSVSYCLRYAYRKQNLGNFTPSRLFIYFNGRDLAGYPVDEDTGLTIRDGYKSVGKYSACGEKNWPYNPDNFAKRPPGECYEAAQQHKTFRYIKLDNDLNQMKKCLKDGFPISFGTALFESFMSSNTAQTGIVTVPNPKTEKRCGGHAMTIVGHNDEKQAFLVVNNWGTAWGMNGFCWFPYAYMVNDDYVGDLWSIRWFS